MTVPLPQIAIGDGIEVIEIDEPIRAAVHHRERDWAAFHDQTLVNAFSGACGLEEPLAETAVRAGHGVTKKRLGRLAEDRLDKIFDVSLGKVLLACDFNVRRGRETLRHVVASDWWGAGNHQPSHPREAGNHLDAD